MLLSEINLHARIVFDDVKYPHLLLEVESTPSHVGGWTPES